MLLRKSITAVILCLGVASGGIYQENITAVILCLGSCQWWYLPGCLDENTNIGALFIVALLGNTKYIFCYVKVSNALNERVNYVMCVVLLRFLCRILSVLKCDQCGSE